MADSHLFARLLDTLIPYFPDEDSRVVLLYETLYNTDSITLDTIELDGSPAVFTSKLVRSFLQYGEIGQLIKLLKTIKDRLGTENQTEIDKLINELSATRTISQTDGEDTLDYQYTSISFDTGEYNIYMLTVLVSSTFGLLTSVIWLFTSDNMLEPIIALIGFTVAIILAIYVLQNLSKERQSKNKI